jgi:hypothetical protein
MGVRKPTELVVCALGRLNCFAIYRMPLVEFNSWSYSRISPRILSIPQFYRWSESNSCAMWERQNASTKQRYFSTLFSIRGSIPYELSECVLLFHGRCLRISTFDPEDVAKSIHPAVRDRFSHHIGPLIQLDQGRQKLDLFEGFRTLFYRFHST